MNYNRGDYPSQNFAPANCRPEGLYPWTTQQCAMNIVIVGAGRIGSSVLKFASEASLEITVIEQEPERAHVLESTENCEVINGDATDRNTLRRADVGDANAIITTTAEDAANMMVLMVARDMGCERLVSVVHDEANLPLFRQLGATVIENPQRLIAEYLFRGVQNPSMKDFMHVGEPESDAEVFELAVGESAPIVDKTLEEADIEGWLPPSMIVVAVERDGEIIIPRGHTTIEEGDLVTVFSKEGATTAVTEPFDPTDGNSTDKTTE